MDTAVSISVVSAPMSSLDWLAFSGLDVKYRVELIKDSCLYIKDLGDLYVARKQLDLGTRAVILAYSRDIPLGFQRVDKIEGKLWAGSIYVEPELRRVRVTLENTPWMCDQKNYGVAHYLGKAGYLLSRRGGWQGDEMGTYVHNGNGDQVSTWFVRQWPRWEPEVGNEELKLDQVFFRNG
ncbi:MAG TPA: hypothetical protein VJG90_03800 [Candidatus Nanoarchaeia archaeon]|nr:hypothetical protein [Candidatus Nanoarchaeia archaeon]